MQWQRQRTCAAAEAEDNDGWGEAGRSGGGGGATAVRWRRRNSFTIRPWRMEVEDGRGGPGPAGCSFLFLFLAGLNPTFNPTLYNTTKNRGYFLWFWGEIFVTIQGSTEIGRIGVRLGVILWSFSVILPPILPRILPQSYLKICWDYGPERVECSQNSFCVCDSQTSRWIRHKNTYFLLIRPLSLNRWIFDPATIDTVDTVPANSMYFN